MNPQSLDSGTTFLILRSVKVSLQKGGRDDLEGLQIRTVTSQKRRYLSTWSVVTATREPGAGGTGFHLLHHFKSSPLSFFSMDNGMFSILHKTTSALPNRTVALPMAGVGDGGGGEVASYAEGPATINASDTQWGQISAQNIRLLLLLCIHLPPPKNKTWRSRKPF